MLSDRLPLLHERRLLSVSFFRTYGISCMSSDVKVRSNCTFGGFSFFPSQGQRSFSDNTLVWCDGRAGALARVCHGVCGMLFFPAHSCGASPGISFCDTEQDRIVTQDSWGSWASSSFAWSGHSPALKGSVLLFSVMLQMDP